jgi:hypothetical protein
MASRERDELRQFWAEETDEALFQALTIGRDKYTESALRVVADEAARRGLTKPGRMKQLAEELKARGPLPPAGVEDSDVDPIEHLPGVLQALAFVVVMAALILVRIGIRRLF